MIQHLTCLRHHSQTWGVILGGRVGGEWRWGFILGGRVGGEWEWGVILGGRVGGEWRWGSRAAECRAAGGGWWGSGVCRQGGRGPFSWGTCNHKSHQHSCPASAGPRGPWRHRLLIKLRPGSKHSSTPAASQPTRLQTPMKSSAAHGRDDLKGITTHIVKASGAGSYPGGSVVTNPPSTAGDTGFRPCSTNTPHAKEQPSPRTATTEPAL